MTFAASISHPTQDAHSALVAWSAASVLALAVAGAGVIGSMPLPVFGWAAVFLFFAVASDVRSYRVPNLLTLPALAGALLVSPWFGGTQGPMDAALGAALGFGLLIGPYAVGGVGAGDVKALMALGAWIGVEAILGSAGWAMIAAGSFGLALLALRGELLAFAMRWAQTLTRSVCLRRIDYQPPTAGSRAAGGIPFAAALAIGLAAQWFGGAPW
jgi:prepilin peptidase CpaA